MIQFPYTDLSLELDIHPRYVISNLGKKLAALDRGRDDLEPHARRMNDRILALDKCIEIYKCWMKATIPPDFGQEPQSPDTNDGAHQSKGSGHTCSQKDRSHGLPSNASNTSGNQPNPSAPEGSGPDESEIQPHDSATYQGRTNTDSNSEDEEDDSEYSDDESEAALNSRVESWRDIVQLEGLLPPPEPIVLEDPNPVLPDHLVAGRSIPDYAISLANRKAWFAAHAFRGEKSR